ncbi:6-bladed beta-propeller [Geobacter sp. DSM 9736]|uniref:6-bladed beta-propeller n=1 Tax=Geobacter sp. DSM 9736 TaxID=1277350 RepID=UPI000B601E6C|nr:6-bladed beta-propeller [Geobacter sp. DSM 9736]SNB45749.1 6-bladed beta-propeller protein [Geobacter sp. DSM 9736]
MRWRSFIIHGFIAGCSLVLTPINVCAILPPRIATLPPITEGLRTPIRLVQTNSETVYVTDPRSGGIIHIDLNGKVIKHIPTDRIPIGIAVTSQGELLVTQEDHVVILDGSGAKIGVLGAATGQFKLANGITLDDVGNIYVSDSLANCVQVFDRNGRYIFRFGERGSEPGQLSSPTGITFERNSRQIAVADTLNGRIQFFDLAGLHKKTIGSYGTGPLRFTSPQAVTFEYETHTGSLTRMYAVDSFQSTVQVINPSGSGTFIGYVGSYGTSPGKLVNPSDVAFSQASRKLMVVNSLASGISQFRIGIDSTVREIPLHLTIDQVPTIITTPSLTISGTVTTGARLSASVTTGLIRSIKYPTPSTWGMEVELLSTGINKIEVRATSDNGEHIHESISVCLTTALPTITIDPIPSLSNSPYLQLTGTKAANDTVLISTDSSAVVGLVSYPSATTWQAAVSGLSQGDNTLTAVATNGSAISATTTKVTIDTTPPSLTVSTLPNESSAAEPLMNITGIATDEHLDKILVNANEAAIYNSIFSSALILKGGTNNLEISAYDKAGNITTIKRGIRFIIPTPPVIVTSPADNSWVETGVITLVGKTEPGYDIMVNDIAATLDGSRWEATVPLGSGMNTLQITASQPVGASYSLKRTIFSGPGPAFSLTVPPEDTATKEETVSLSGSVESGTSLSYTINGTSYPLTQLSGVFSLTSALRQEGVYPIVVTAIDSAGNPSTIIRTLIRDVTPPAISLKLNTDVLTSKVITGEAETGAVISARNENTVIASTVAIEGNWALDLNGYNFTRDSLAIIARDAAGNERVRSLYSTGAIVSGGGEPDLRDAVKLFRIAFGYDQPSPQELETGDIAPLKNGKPSPDGIIDANDVILVLCRLIGLIQW